MKANSQMGIVHTMGLARNHLHLLPLRCWRIVSEDQGRKRATRKIANFCQAITCQSLIEVTMNAEVASSIVKLRDKSLFDSTLRTSIFVVLLYHSCVLPKYFRQTKSYNI